jgi:ketosteroid isomerase-like protein
VSQEHVEVVKAAINAANRQDWDATIRDTACGFEIDLSRAVGPWRGVFTLDQLRQFVGDFAESWESVSVEPHQFIESGDLVVVPWTLHAKGRAGIEVLSRATFVWTVRDGAIVRVSMYQERREALKAVGLEE